MVKWSRLTRSLLVVALSLAAVATTRVPIAVLNLTPRAIGQESYERYGIAEKLRSGDFRLYNNGRGRLRWHYPRKVDVQDKYGTQYELFVENDVLTYVFDSKGNFLRKIEQWTDIGDLPLIEVTRQQAESIAEPHLQEDITASRLVLIAPGTSGVDYRLDSPAVNPCWVVYTDSSGPTGSLVIDAVTSDIIGRGAPCFCCSN